MSVSLYDTLGAESTEFIVSQTELKTLFTTKDKIQVLTKLKAKGMIQTVKTIVCFDRSVSEEAEKAANEAGFELLFFHELVEEGKQLDTELTEPAADDIYTFCYTSGTTGTPKGAMITHKNIVGDAAGAIHVVFDATHADVHFSYLPLAHLFERLMIMTAYATGMAVGFYQGDVLKLREDLAELRPTIMPSVPRLYNRFYDIMQSRLRELTGVKKKIAEWGIARKLANLDYDGRVTHSVYDRILFNKFKAILGGRIRLMCTGSAPIAKEVLNFLRIAFCCHIQEGYG